MQGLWHLPSQQPNNIEKAKCYPQSWESVLEFCVSYSAHPVGSFHYQIIIPKYQPATGKFVVVTSHYNHYNRFLLETWQWFVSVKDYNDYNFTAMPVCWNRWKRRSPRFFAPAAPARVVASSATIGANGLGLCHPAAWGASYGESPSDVKWPWLFQY